MSDLNVDEIRDAAATGAPDFPNGLTNNGDALAKEPSSMVRVDSGNAHGTDSNNKIRRFTNVTETVGTAITYADNAGPGATFTVNEDGVYAISYSDRSGTNGHLFGISVNSSQLTTSITAITVADRLVAGSINEVEATNVGATVRLSSGDVVRPHTDGNPNNTGASVQFIITQVVKL